MPTVSVVVPCYKYGHYVTDCVTSILTNTEVDLDVLVIDDASPDDSWEVVRRTSAHHRVGPYRHDLPYSSDMELWMRLASVGDVLWVGGPFAAYYRVSATSMSRAIYMDPLRELNVRRDAFLAWYEFADGL